MSLTMALWNETETVKSPRQSTEAPGLPTSPENSSSTIYHDCQDDPFVFVPKQPPSVIAVRSASTLPPMASLVEQLVACQKSNHHKMVFNETDLESQTNHRAMANRVEWSNPKPSLWCRAKRCFWTLWSNIVALVVQIISFYSIGDTWDGRRSQRSCAPSPSSSPRTVPSRHLHSSRLRSPALMEPEFVCSDVPFLSIRSFKAPLFEDSGMVEYQTWIDESRQHADLDLVFLPDSMSYFVSCPDAVHGFLEKGYRIVSIDFHSVDRNASVTRMAEMIDAVLRNLSQREAFSKRASSISSPSPAGPRSSVTSTRVLSFSKAYGQPVRSALKHRPVFLLGIGIGALVATEFALSQSPYTSHDLRLGSSPLHQVFGKIRARTLHRTWNSIGLLPNKPIDGLILVSPHAESTKSCSTPGGRSKRIAKREQHRGIQHLGANMAATPPSSATRKVVDGLLRNLNTLRVPCLIMHGTRDPFTSPSAVTRFYEMIGSRDKCLSLYPGKGHFSASDRFVADPVVHESLQWLEEHTTLRVSPSPDLKSKVRFDETPLAEKRSSATPTVDSMLAGSLEIELPRIRVSHDLADLYADCQESEAD